MGYALFLFFVAMGGGGALVVELASKLARCHVLYHMVMASGPPPLFFLCINMNEPTTKSVYDSCAGSLEIFPQADSRGSPQQRHRFRSDVWMPNANVYVCLQRWEVSQAPRT